MRDLLNVESSQRVDLRDFVFGIDEGAQAAHRELMSQFLLDPDVGGSYKILEGFEIDCPSGKQVRVTRGKAILGQREGALALAAVLTTTGDAQKIVDITAFAGGIIYGVYVRFELVDGENEVRSFWDPSGGGSEYQQTIATKRLANWSMRVESSSPGGEWLYIGDIDKDNLAPTTTGITDKRDFFFEGSVDSTYQSGWSTAGGGSSDDRDPDRKTYGITNLHKFTAAVRQLFEDLRPTGGRWWEKRGLKSVGTGSDPGGHFTGAPGEEGVIANGGAGNSSGVVGNASGSGVGVEALADTTGQGLYGQGGSVSGDGVWGNARGGNSHGCRGDGDGTGSGHYGYSASGTAIDGVSVTGGGVRGTSTDGHGAIARSTGSVSSSLRIVPQSQQPSNTNLGSVFTNTYNGKLRAAPHTGSIWERLVPQVYMNTSDSGTITGTSGLETAFDKKYTVPANSLRTLSTIRFQIGLQILGCTGTDTLSIQIRFGGLTGTLVSLTGNFTPAAGSGEIALVGNVAIRNAGTPASTTWSSMLVGNYLGSGPTTVSFTNVKTDGGSTYLDTSVDADFVVTADWGGTSGTNQIELHNFVVDITG